MRRTRCTPARRRGIQTLELILAFPPLLLLFFGGLQMALTATISQAVTAAAHEAARGCELGLSIDDTAAAVDRVLEVHGFGIGPGVRLVLQDDTGTLASRGDNTLTSLRLSAPPPPGTCRAVLIVNVSATPAPNLLAVWCVDFSNRRLESSSVITRPAACS